MNPFNHDLAAPDAPMVNVNFNGKWVQVPKGLNVVEVTRRLGGFLPHYCYHPKLSISGNCRMCLFEMGMPKLDAQRQPIVDDQGRPEIAWIPRPQIGCATQVTEGMGIRTDSPLAEECRRGVMEFLLINHPLDCPICDQAGECKLQEFSSEYGTAQSRFVEQKVKKPKNVDLGKNIVLDDERCIMCSRCIRFAREVMHDDVLGFVDRGSYTTLTCHPGKKFDNAYSLNTVDICPVGALTSKDFRFKMRVWFLKETSSICTGCGTGCNVTIGSREDIIYRLTPRENEAVNSLWMCDQGRLGFHYLHDDRRITRPLVRVGQEAFPAEWPAAIEQTASLLKGLRGDQLAILASTRMTNEELFLVSLLAHDMKIDLVDVVPRTEEPDGFLRCGDLNPNSLGAELLGVSKGGRLLSKMAAAIREKQIDGLICLHESPEALSLDPGDLGHLSALIQVTLLPDSFTNKAHVVLPGAGFAEKRGSMINVHGRLQRLNVAVPPPGAAREDWEILRDLRLALTGGNGLHALEDVFAAMAGSFAPLAGLNLSKIGAQGVQLDLARTEFSLNTPPRSGVATSAIT